MAVTVRPVRTTISFSSYHAADSTAKSCAYICEADAWGSLPYDLLSLAYAHLGDAESAAAACREAVALAPNEERLRKNLALFEQMRER